MHAHARPARTPDYTACQLWSLLVKWRPRKFGTMSQPYGLSGGVVPPPAPPPAGPPRWYPSAPPPPRPPRGRRKVAALGVAAGLIATAIVAGAAGALITSARETPTLDPVQPSAPPAGPSSVAAETAMCETLASEYPKVVAAIDDRSKYNKTPWTDPAIIASSDKLAQVTWATADALELTLLPGMRESYRKPAVEYVAALRAVSVSYRDRAKDLQLNGVGSFYNSVADPVLAVCGIKG